MSKSMLSETLAHVCTRSAAAVVARGRIANSALNSVLLRRLSALPGAEESLLSAPVFEAARVWEQAGQSLGELAGSLLDSRLVDALDGAANESMPRDRHPYTHQLAAWQAARDGISCLVTSGTGSGKTECFMVPMLDDLLRDPAKGRLAGIRAIVIYPLNALIESQRERLSAWTEALRDRITFALYNGLTPETPREVKRELGKAEIGSRREIRKEPPSILITNVTMLEYLLLRCQDQSILERSQGLLRWIVLDEAHGYIGAQAAEMALLLRRVRAAFGVEPEQVRLMATSATISEGSKTEDKLKRFVADLACVRQERVTVIKGREAEPELPPPGPDAAVDPSALISLPPEQIWQRLARHPRLRQVKTKMKAIGLRLAEISDILYGNTKNQEGAQTFLDAAALARDPQTGRHLLPWRAHLFQRAQGGLWACIDPGCPHRDAELAAADAGWGFGALWLAQRDHCVCGAPTFEILACTECGAPHLVAGREAGAMARLIPHQGAESDEFAVDEEPDPDADHQPLVRGTVWLRPARGATSDRHVSVKDGKLYDNGAPSGVRAVPIHVIETAEHRDCCGNAARAGLRYQRYGASFFMGTVLPDILERLSPPLHQPGLPMGGRRALTFSDSRQGVARLAAKLQQDAERTLTRAFLYHTVQEDHGPSPQERAKLENKLKRFQTDPNLFAEDIAEIERKLSGGAKALSWSDLVHRFGAQQELAAFATKVWAERDWGGLEMAENPEKLAEMFLFRELFRRPRVQNNAETMGLHGWELRLTALEV
jgi:DEAD/DEAH box helicase domain-containing protein